MTVKELVQELDLEPLCQTEHSLQKEIESGFCCDLNSFVMANAPEKCAWLTVLGNINSIAVCIYSNISVLILTGGERLDKNATKKAMEYDIPVFTTQEHSFELSAKISELLKSFNSLK